MGWNHRVVRHVNPSPLDKDEEYYYQVHEVYYNSDGEVTMMTKEGVSPYGNNIEDLTEILEWMTKALTKPILDYDMEFADDDFDIDVPPNEEFIPVDKFLKEILPIEGEE